MHYCCRVQLRKGTREGRQCYEKLIVTKGVVHSIWEGGNTIRDIIVNAMVKRVVLEDVYIVLLEGRTYILTSTCAVSYMCRGGNIYPVSLQTFSGLASNEQSWYSSSWQNRECNRLCVLQPLYSQRAWQLSYIVHTLIAWLFCLDIAL